MYGLSIQSRHKVKSSKPHHRFLHVKYHQKTYWHFPVLPDTVKNRIFLPSARLTQCSLNFWPSFPFSSTLFHDISIFNDLHCDHYQCCQWHPPTILTLRRQGPIIVSYAVGRVYSISALIMVSLSCGRQPHHGFGSSTAVRNGSIVNIDDGGQLTRVYKR